MNDNELRHEFNSLQLQINHLRDLMHSNHKQLEAEIFGINRSHSKQIKELRDKSHNECYSDLHDRILNVESGFVALQNKSPFEAISVKSDGMTFGEAMTKLKHGKAIRRKGKHWLLSSRNFHNGARADFNWDDICAEDWEIIKL